MSQQKTRMIAFIAANGGHNGWSFTALPGHGCYMAETVKPRRVLRELVHVALDGSIRYSDAARYGEIWSLGVCG